MPANFEMSWEPDARRWKRMHKGVLYKISVRQLRKHFNDPSIPDTKEGSYQWANRWWREQSAGSRDYSRTSHPHPAGSDIAILERRREWARRHGETDLERELTEEIGETTAAGRPNLDPDGTIAWKMRMLSGMGVQFPPDFEPFAARMFLGTDDAVWHDRLLRDQEIAASTPSDRKVGVQIARYLDLQLARHRAGQIAAPTWDNIRHDLNAFRDWLGADSPIEAITADRWEAWWLHLLTSGLPIDTRRKRLRDARSFITWAVSRGLIPAPANLNTRLHRFKAESPAIRTVEPADLKRLISSSDGVLKLLLLLMANCGFTQQDASDLHPSEVDWESGRIRRKRSKTGENPHVPVVDYLLWSETWELLRKYGRRTGDHALLTKSGKPWVRDDLHPDGRRHRVDAIRSSYRHLKGSASVPLKLLRKSSASLLDAHPEYGRYVQHYLGHAPQTVATAHYVQPSRDQFDCALRYLASCYGFTPR